MKITTAEEFEIENGKWKIENGKWGIEDIA